MPVSCVAALVLSLCLAAPAAAGDLARAAAEGDLAAVKAALAEEPGLVK